MTVVVDLGCADRGQWYSLEALIEEYHPTKVWGFDPSPGLDTSITSIMGTKVKLVRKAAWTYDGKIEFTDDYIASRMYTIGVGPLFTGNPLPGRIGMIGEGPVKVPCFDFSKWLKKHGPCVVKMDIEGAEYGLLSHLILDGSANLMEELVVEWHAGIAEDLVERLDCRVRNWWM